MSTSSISRSPAIPFRRVSQSTQPYRILKKIPSFLVSGVTATYIPHQTPFRDHHQAIMRTQHSISWLVICCKTILEFHPPIFNNLPSFILQKTAIMSSTPASLDLQSLHIQPLHLPITNVRECMYATGSPVTKHSALVTTSHSILQQCTLVLGRHNMSATGRAVHVMVITASLASKRYADIYKFVVSVTP